MLYVSAHNVEIIRMNSQSNFHNSADQMRLSRLLVNIILFIITIVAAFYVLKTGNRLYMIAVVALPFAIMLSNHLDLAYVLMLLAGATMIKLPAAAHVPISWVLLLLMIGVFALNFLMRRSTDSIGKKVKGSGYLKAFAVVIIVLMVVRGAGIRALGSSTWGGTPYIILLSSIIFYMLAVPVIRISRKQIRVVLWWSLFLGILGAFLRYRGVGEGANELIVTETRAIWLRPFVMAVLPVVFAIVAPRRWMISAVLFVMCLGLIMMTGFRSRFVMLLVLALGFGFFKTQNKGGYIAKAMSIGVIMWISVVLLSPMLPPSMQRAVSFVPGTTIDFMVAKNAAHSVDWRVEIWGYAIKDLPDYWLIGRGVAFDVMAAVQDLGIEVGLGGPFQAYHTHTYHSGPITLLIDFGIPGTLIYFAFMVFVFKTVWRIAKKIANRTELEYQYLLFYCVYVMWLIFCFWFVFGDVDYLSNIIMLTSQILIVYSSLQALEVADDPEQVEIVQNV